MKNLLKLVWLMAMLPLIITMQAQDKKGQYIEWTGEDEIAKELVHRGIGHFLNIENEKAITYMQSAALQDPSLFGPHVVLTWLSKGDQKAHHKAQAQELVKDNNEVSRLFVSLLDVEKGEAGDVQSREILAKMHKIASDARLVHFFYALSLEDPNNTIAELEKLAAKNEKDNHGTSYIHNRLGYYYYGMGNKEKALAHFEKYIELYPEGYNAYDSMGEYYLNENNHEKALEFYQMAVAHYPAAMNANKAVANIKEMMSEEGQLVVVDIEHVAPEHMADYMTWGEEYKAIADQTGARTFWVANRDATFSYASRVGKRLADIEAVDEETDAWRESNPALGELYQKYRHSITYTEREVWRHMPAFSYHPEEMGEQTNTYVRAHVAYVKFGHEQAVMDLMKEYKQLWADNGMSTAYSVYHNEYGKEGYCISFRSTYPDVAAWTAEEEEIMEKIGEEKITDIRTRWVSHLRHWESMESTPVPSMTHIQEDVVVASGN